MKIYFKLIIVLFIILNNLEVVSAPNPPYPLSPVIESVTWDFTSLSRAARGSDLFPLTWADDNNLYTAWGDGWGFSESGSKKSSGVSAISGPPTSFIGTDLWSSTGKAHGIISIDGLLYIFVTEEYMWMRGKVGRSMDHAITWKFTDWIFDEPGGVFAAPGILQFGRGYQGARDHFVYGYSEIERGVIQPHIALFRVPKDQLINRNAYEFFAGLDGNGRPVWTADVKQLQPVFTDPNGVDWGMQAAYNPVLRRYLLTVRHDCSGGWGIFDAPEPWGPWTTVAYYNNWIDSKCKLTFIFNQKWTSTDGTTMWIAFSGRREYDSFNVIKAKFNLWKGVLNIQPQENNLINK